MPNSHCKITDHIKDQTACTTPKPISLFSDENYLNEPQDTEFIRTIINLIKELMKS